MKINEVIQEGIGTGLLKIGKEVSKYLSPALAKKLEYALNTANIAKMARDMTSQDNRIARIGDIVASQASRQNNSITPEQIYNNIPKSGYATSDQRVAATKAVMDYVKQRGIDVTSGLTNPPPPAPEKPHPQAIKIGDETIQPNDPRYAKIMKAVPPAQ